MLSDFLALYSLLGVLHLVTGIERALVPSASTCAITIKQLQTRIFIKEIFNKDLKLLN